MSSAPVSENELAGLINLADASLGAMALDATDEFFAPKERLLSPAEPESRPNTYDDNGQWMDGWETRRRTPGPSDACIVRLAYPGTIKYVDLDTRFFTGNFPPAASIDATNAQNPTDSGAAWTEILPRGPLIGDDHNLFAIVNQSTWRDLRLNIYPDGGIARLRAYGEIYRDWADVREDEVLDLFAIENGGTALACNDQHYGNIRNLNRPGRGKDMGDGWETRRRREPGSDWVIIRLGHPGLIQRVEIDTAHFKGNYPDAVSIEAALVTDVSPDALEESSNDWPELLGAQPIQADHQHRFDELQALGPVSHLRVNIHPDGGLSRVRVYGLLHRP